MSEKTPKQRLLEDIAALLPEDARRVTMTVEFSTQHAPTHITSEFCMAHSVRRVDVRFPHETFDMRSRTSREDRSVTLIVGDPVVTAEVLR